MEKLHTVIRSDVFLAVVFVMCFVVQFMYKWMAICGQARSFWSFFVEEEVGCLLFFMNGKTADQFHRGVKVLPNK